MRLLNVKTFRLEEFFEKDIPKYAILSHTWGAEEVTFKDFEAFSTARPSLSEADFDFTNTLPTIKQGWRKIKLAARQTLSDQHTYLWIDTICIDKSSSAELTESINSMFRWYHNSQICYAYLSDVPAAWAADVELENIPEHHLHAYLTTPFAKSRWWTRGWTLQEMIAPRFVQFFAEDYVFLGSKFKMVELIGMITGINGEILRYADQYRLSVQSVARKMSWAAHRETTRPEDEAYCLLGLFGINMTMIYGEGHNAFLRLQEEIIKKTNDQSVLLQDTMDLLATSPKSFQGLNHIVRYENQAFGSSVHNSLTNKGLDITGPVICKDKRHNTQFTIALNCREEQNYEALIALNVIQTESNTNVYEVVERTSMPESVALSCPKKKIIVEAPSSEKKDVQLLLATRDQPFRIIILSPLLQICDSCPSLHFHRSGNVMILPPSFRKGSVLIQVALSLAEGGPRLIGLIFGTHSMTAVSWLYLLEMNEGQSISEVFYQTGVSVDNRLQKTSIRLRGSKQYLTAAVEKKELMKTIVECITVGIGPALKV